jgi:hypothetical protein
MKMLTLALSLCSVPLLALQTGSQPARGANDPAIVAVADQYIKATMAGDAKAIAALYTDDAVEMPPNEPSVKGSAAIQQMYEKNFQGGKDRQFHADPRREPVVRRYWLRCWNLPADGDANRRDRNEGHGQVRRGPEAGEW